MSQDLRAEIKARLDQAGIDCEAGTLNGELPRIMEEALDMVAGLGWEYFVTWCCLGPATKKIVYDLARERGFID